MTTGTQPDFGIVWSASLARAPADQVAEWLAFAQAMCDEADAIALRVPDVREYADVLHRSPRKNNVAAQRLHPIENLVK